MPPSNSYLLAADQTPDTTLTLAGPDHTIGTVRRTVLPNGLRVLTEETPGASATVMIGVGAGSRDEGPDEHGAAHFLEHLLFCGTPTRSKDTILTDYERIGDRYNAATGFEQTRYHATVRPQDVPAAIDLIGDMVTGGVYTDQDVENERRIIGQEIARVYDNLVSSTWEEAVAGLFGADTPLGHSIGGTQHSVEQITRAQIEKFRQAQYGPDRTVLVVTGDVEHDMIVKQAANLFPEHPRTGVAPVPPRPAEQVHTHHGTVRSPRDSQQSHVAIAVEGLSHTDARNPAQDILAAALGGLRTSRMYYSIREQRGLAYSVSAQPLAHTETGVLLSHAGCAVENRDEVLDLMRQALAEAAEEGFSDDELERARARASSQAMASWEQGKSRAEHLFFGELHRGQPTALSRYLTDLAEVTVQDLNSLATDLLSRPQLTVLLGNVH